MTVIAKDDISKYYDDFYSFLIQSGIDLVKTDAQCLLDNFENASGRRELTNAYLDKWAVASLRHFGRNAISCMSQFPQAIVHAHMPQIRPPVVMRNSDDYFPDEEPSHRWHVWANAHNAMLTQYLNVIPDWDMFQTLHKYGHYHAAARCISGGPIYITDQPGHHDVSVVDEMIATSPQGRTVVLRPSVIGRALDPYLDYNADRLLQIGGYHGKQTDLRQINPPLIVHFRQHRYGNINDICISDFRRPKLRTYYPDQVPWRDAYGTICSQSLQHRKGFTSPDGGRRDASCSSICR